MDCEYLSSISEVVMKIIEILAGIASVAGAIVSVVVYRHTVNREKKILTIRDYGKIRDKYPNALCKHRRLEYLKDMEYFCVGVNEGIYDIEIVKKMGGRRLLGIYNKLKNFIRQRRRTGKSDQVWNEYESVMLRLQKMYDCEQCNKMNCYCNKKQR